MGVTHRCRAGHLATIAALVLAHPCIAAGGPTAVAEALVQATPIRERVADLPVTALPAPALSAGARIYRLGQGADGHELIGRSISGSPLRGTASACANCHGRSGLGGHEGGIAAPAINGAALAQASPNAPYDPQSFLELLQTGVTPRGTTLSAIMPRFEISERDAQAVWDYLQPLSITPSAGVTQDRIDLATVIAPDVAAADGAQLESVISRYIALHNAAYGTGQQAVIGELGPSSGRGRRWVLHVWRLVGPPSSWEDQLVSYFSAQPVLALVSGAGRDDWTPVDRFCETRGLACVLPHVDAPPANPSSNALYFSEGLLLEADLLMAYLKQPQSPPVHRLVQIYRHGDAALQAVERIDVRARALGIATRRVVVGNGAAPSLKLAPNEALVSWLEPDDWRVIPRRPPGALTFASATRLSSALIPADPSANWPGPQSSAPNAAASTASAKPSPAHLPLVGVRLLYPYALPSEHLSRLNYVRSWFDQAGVSVTNEPLAMDAWVACDALSGALSSVKDHLVADYVMETVRSQLGERLLNGRYSRLAASGQDPFASHGGYIAVQQQDGTLVPLSAWLVP